MLKKLILSISLLFLLGLNQHLKAQYVPDYRYPDSVFNSMHSPHKATFYSAVLPGLGQIYNQKYWKVPIIYAAFGGLLYYANYNNFVYKKYSKAYDIKYRIEQGETDLEDEYPNYGLENLKNVKDSWRRYRDLCYIGIGFFYVIQIIDADVDAHLFDYDMSENLSLRFDPVIIPNQFYDYKTQSSAILGLRCSINF